MGDQVIRLLPGGDPVSGMHKSDMTAADAFTSDDHSELNHTFFATPDESVLTGVWECAPCREEIDSYPVHEMMTVISGKLTVTNADGHPETFTAGDTIYIAKGAKCIWHIEETLRKFYMIVE
jgi:uncharacterized cupin superfamily protein